MQKGIGLSLFVFLCLINVCFSAQTFSPIHPGSLHVDQLSTLDNNRVNVPDFTVAGFGAAVLDFQSLTSATPVSVTTAGGINFEGETINLSGAGDVTIQTSVNDIPINALNGQFSVTSNSGDSSVVAWGSDISIDSANSNIDLSATSGSVNFEAATFALQGRQSTGGLSLNTQNNGDISIAAGQASNLITGQVNFVSYDLNIDLSSAASITSQSGNVYFSASQDIDVSSAAISVESNSGISTTSDVGSILLEADGAMTFSANTVNFLTSNGQAYSSVTGNIGISATDTSYYQALDAIELTGVNSGVYVSAYSNIEAVAGNNVVIDSDAEFQVSSYDFTVYSQKDSYIIDTTGNTIMSTTSSVSVTTDGDSQIQADQTVNVQGTSVSFNVDVDTTITTGNTFQITSNTGNPGDVTFDSNNLWIDAIDHVDFGGNSVQIQTNSDINFESGLGITMSAANTIAVSASQSGLLEGQSDVTLKSALISNIGVDQLTIVSGDDTNFESQTINVTLSGSIFETTSDTTFIAGHMLFQSGSSNFQSNEFTAATKNAFALNSSSITFVAQNEFDSTSNTFTGSANDALFVVPNSDFVATTDGKTVFENDMNDGSSTQIFANLLIDVNSGSASFTGDQLTSTQSASSYFVGTNTFTISAGNYLEISSVAFGLKADGELNFQAGSLELNGAEVYFTASDAFGGDVAFTTNGAVKLDSNSVNGNADRTEIYGYNTLSFSSDATFSLENTQSGDIKFETSGNYYHENNVGALYFIANTIVGSGDSGVSLSSPSGPIAISSSLKQDVSFLSGGNFNVDTGDFSLSSNIVAFNGVEGGSIDSAVYNITATGSVAYSSNGYININGTSTVSNTATSTSLGGSENVVIQGGQLTFDVASGVINANGGGARFYSGADTIFSTSATSDSFVVEAYHLNSYVAESGSVSLKSNTGAFSISGGESNYLSGVNSTIELTAAAGAISIATSDNGNFTLYSDNDLIENTAQTLYFTGNPGRDGLVTSTMNDSSICIRSDFNSGDTSFASAKSMNIDSLGDEGLIVMYADYNVAVTAISHSVGILSEGYQTDPQFILNDTFGILLRTTHDGNGTSSIQLESGSNDISMFARGFFNVTSNDGTIVQSSGGNTDIRTRFYDADILVETWNGNINYAIDEDGYFISGTASIRADTLINATGTQTWSAGSNMILRQIASIQDPSDSAIVIEGYRGNVTLNAGQATTFTANDGGRIFGEARNGDITLISGGNVAITAETAAVEFEARTAATFTLSDSTSFDASGIAGSMLIATPGGNDITINAGGLISFDSTIGGIDLKVTTGITSVSTADTILTAPCNHLYGGGSLSIVTGQHILLQTLDNSIYFDANEEFTVDATSVKISGSSVDPIVRVNAGGDTQTPGLSVTSQGDVVFATQVNIDNSNILTSIISTSNISISASATMNVTSYGDSSSQTNIILQADNSAIDTQTNQFSSLSLTETQITTSSLMNFVSVNSSIDINAVREVRYNAVSMDITVAGGYTGTAIDQIFTSNEGGSISFSVGSGFYAASDSFLGFEAGGAVTLQISDTLQFSSGRGKANFQADGVMTFTSNNFEFNSVDGTEVAGLNGVSATATTSTSMSSFESTILHAKNDIQYNNVNDFSFAGNTFTSTSGGKLTATVGNDLTFNSYDFLISAANDMDISSVLFTVESPNDQYITFTAGGDFDITSATQGYTSHLNTYFTSNAGIEDEYLNGIEVLSGTLDFTASTTDGVFSLDSASSVLLAVTTSGLLTSTKGSLSFYSSGTNGVYIRGPTLTQTSSTGTNVEAYDGNIGFHGSATLSAVDTLLTTSNAYGNIRLYSSSSVSYTSDTSLTIQPPGDPGMYKGYGNITFTSDSITLQPSATIDASSSNKIFVRSLDDMTLTFGATSFDANRKIQFGGSVSTFSSSLVSVTSPETLLDAPIISSISTTTNSFSSSGALDVIAGGNLVLNSPVLNLQSADDFLFTADGSFISIPSLSLTDIVSDLFGISANVGDISIGATTIDATIVHIASQNGIYLSGGASTIDSVILNFVSAGDFYLNSNDGALLLTSTSTAGVDISTSGEGNVVIDSNSFTLKSTASSVSILAKGNLGSIGGRYVLEDNYLNNEGTFHHKESTGLHWANNFYTRQSININTIAIETTNVNGDLDISSVGTMDIVSHKGNIEFEAIYSVQHDQPTTTGLTFFFAQSDSNNGKYGTYIPGRYNPLGFTIRTDYCNSPEVTCNGGCSAVDCVNLSNLINAMANALIDYGLVSYP